MWCNHLFTQLVHKRFVRPTKTCLRERCQLDHVPTCIHIIITHLHYSVHLISSLHQHDVFIFPI